MKLSYFLLLSFLVLVPTDLGTGGGVSCEPVIKARSFENKKKVDNYMSSVCSKNEEGREQLPVTVRYSATDEEKCLDGKKIKIKDEIGRKEVETVKDAAVKWQSAVADKSKKQYGVTCDSLEPRESNLDLGRDEFKFERSGPRGQVLCAECDECQLQVTATGDGVQLRCKGCREVPPDEVTFPGGNNRIIRLP